MKKTLLLSVVASTMIMAGGDIAPVEPVVEAPVEVSGWEFGGQAVLYYQTRDNAAFDIFDSEASAAAAGLQLRAINKDMFAGIGAGVELSGLSDLYLYDGVVSNLVQWAGNAFDPADADTLNSSAAFTQAYLTYGFGNTSIKIGRQNLPKALSPFAFSEGWNVFKNSFEAGLIVNSDLPDTTLVYAYVTRSNGHANLNAFTDINPDNAVHMVTAQNKSIEGLTLTGTWYIAPELIGGVDDVNILWGDAQFGISDFNIGLQGGTILTDTVGVEDTTAFGAKVGGNFGMFDASVAYSSVDEGTIPAHNLGTGVKTPLYTQLILNQGYIKSDSDTFVVKAGVKALGGKFGLAYDYTTYNASTTEDTYTELDLTYKTKVFNDSTTLFAGYVYTDDDLLADSQNFIRVWGRYNF